MNCCGGGGESIVSYPSMLHSGKSRRCTPARRFTPLLPPSHTAVAAQAAPPPPLPCTTSRPNLRPSYFRSTLWGGGRCASGFAAEMREAARADRDVVPSTPLHPPHTFPAPPHVHQRRRGYSQGMRPWNSARANSCSKAGAARALSSVESVETARPARRLIDREAPEPNIAPRRRLGPSRRRPAAQRSSKGGAAAAA